tara:strand:+ start:99 stop:1493 length:1395 start_codon:yes stop_codon:yes gene_type:complete
MAKTRKQGIKNNSRAKTIKNNKNLLSNEGDMEGGGLVTTEKYGLYFQFQGVFNNAPKFIVIRNFLKKTCLFFFRGYYISIKGLKEEGARERVGGRLYSDPADRSRNADHKIAEKEKKELQAEHPNMNKYKYFLGYDDGAARMDENLNEENYLYMLQSVVGGGDKYGLLGKNDYFNYFTEKLNPFEFKNKPIDQNNILEFIMKQLEEIVEPIINNFALHGVNPPGPGKWFDKLDIRSNYKKFVGKKNRAVITFWYTGYVQALTELAYKLLYPKNLKNFGGLDQSTMDLINDYRNIISITKANSVMTGPYTTMLMKGKKYNTPFLCNSDENMNKLIEIVHRLFKDWETYKKEDNPIGKGTEEMLEPEEDADWEKGNQVYKIILMMKLFRFVCWQGKTVSDEIYQASRDITGTRSATPPPTSTEPVVSATWLGAWRGRFDKHTIRMFNRINEAAAQLSTINDIVVGK